MLLQTGCSEKPTPPSAPAAGRAKPAAVVSANEKWSRQFTPDPEWGKPEYEETAWSPSQIAEYHGKLMKKPLPTYATNLKGAGRWQRRYETFAEWCFYIQHNHFEDFETYLEELGVPRASFLKGTMVPLPDAILNAKPVKKVQQLVYFRSVISKSDGEMRDGVIIKKGESVS